jgi:hypothetical protein
LVESVIVPLGQGPILITTPEALDELGSDWREEVRERPAAYLAVRWTLFQRILGISHRPTYVLHPGVDGNTFGFAIANPRANEAFRDYEGWFAADDTFATGSDLFRPWIWLSLGLVASGLLLVPRETRARRGALEVGLAVVGALAYECTFAPLAMGESFRYSYPAVVVSVVGVVFAAATLVTKRLSRAKSTQAPAADVEPASGAGPSDEGKTRLNEATKNPGTDSQRILHPT